MNGIGAAAATGDGDVMMRFLPSLIAVEALRNGKSTQKAAQLAIHRVREFYPKFFGGIVVMNAKGVYSAACNGMQEFPFAVASPNDGGGVRIHTVSCEQSAIEI